MSVVGIDFGNEHSKIAVARRRGIDVLQNEVGKRNTTTLVAYGEKQRFLGDEAVAQTQSNIKNTLMYFKRFLGLTKNDPDWPVESSFVDYKTVAIGDRVGVEVDYEGKPIQLLAEQVTAAMFTKLKKIGEDGMENQKVTDCVIGVPQYWTDQQRRALLGAAKIAGLNVLRLMNETTAVALNWGILKNLDDKPQKVMFVDMGISHTSVLIAEFAAGKLQVVAKHSDRHLGGRNFDQVLVDHFAAYVKTKYKLEVTKDKKAMLKLTKECKRIKLVLSANTKVPFNVEFIMNDKDVSGMIERPEYEAMVQPLIDRFLKVLKETMEQAKLSLDDLHGVEIVGGGTRTPILQTKLQEFIGAKLTLGKTCDSDESVARGCALQCAMLSPSFRVREFAVQDVTPYAISIQWGAADGKEAPAAQNQAEVFPTMSTFPNVKMVSFKDRVAPFRLTAKYDTPPTAGTNPVIGNFVISGMPATEPDKEVPKIKVRVKLDIHGIVTVSGAQVHLVEEQDDVEMKDDANKDGGVSQGRASVDVTTPEGQAAAAAAAEAARMDTSDEKPAAGDAAQPADAKPAVDKKKSVVKKTHNLQVATEINSMLDKKTIDSAAEREAQMGAQDAAVTATNDARNSLESYILEMKNEIEGGDLAKFIPEAAASAFVSKMNEMEEWLYDEGETAQKSDYNAKLAELKKTGDPVVFRSDETKNRPDAVAALKAEIGHWQKVLATPEETAKVEEEGVKKLTKQTQEVDQWLTSELMKQDKMEAFKDPTLTVAMIELKKTELYKFAKKAMTPKPPPPKPAEEKKPEAEAKPAENPAENPADKTADKTADTTAENPAEKPADEPADKPAENGPAKEPKEMDTTAE